MGSSVKLTNYLPQISAEVEKAALNWLDETAGEIESQTARKTRVDTSETKISWTHQVDEGKKEAVIGSDKMNAIYEEYGTGEHATEGKGRSGYWVFVKGSGTSSMAENQKTYTLEQAKRVMAMLRSKGLDAYYTNGKEPNPALHNAWNSVIPKAKKGLSAKLKKIKP